MSDQGNLLLKFMQSGIMEHLPLCSSAVPSRNLLVQLGELSLQIRASLKIIMINRHLFVMVGTVLEAFPYIKNKKWILPKTLNEGTINPILHVKKKMDLRKKFSTS